MRPVRILAEVFEDIFEAAAWYDKEGGVELGERFIDTFHSFLPEIQKFGEVSRPVYTLRGRKCRKKR